MSQAQKVSSFNNTACWDWFSLILPAVAIAPLLFLQGLFLLEKEHLQFYPLAFAAAGYFFYCEGGKQTAYGTRRAFALATSCFFCLVAGYSLVLSSPWMAQLALVCLIWAWAVGKFSNLSLLRISGICGLLAVTVPAPGGWDHRLVQSLQHLSSTICSQLMDATQVLHIKRGNIIEILSKPLFVEEACSGVDSQYALMAVAGVLLLMGRAGLIVSIITIVTVPIWAILGNLLRIYTIVLGLELFEIDLSFGTVHTVLGLVVFMVAAWAHWSSVQFLNYLELVAFAGMPSGVEPEMAEDRPCLARDTQAIENTNTAMKLPWALMILPALLMLLSPIGIAAVMDHYNKEVPSISNSVAESFPGKNDLPMVVGEHGKVDFKHESRNIRSFLGQHSRIWQYSGRGSHQVVSLDMPFRGWHALWECYENAGWRRTGTSQIQQTQNGSTLDFTYFESVLENDEGDFAILHFSLFDEEGRPFTFDGSFARREKGNRFAATFFNYFNRDKTRNEPLTFQFQVLSKTSEPATPDQIQLFRKNYLELRGIIYDKTMPVLRGMKLN